MFGRKAAPPPSQAFRKTSFDSSDDDDDEPPKGRTTTRSARHGSDDDDDDDDEEEEEDNTCNGSKRGAPPEPAGGMKRTGSAPRGLVGGLVDGVNGLVTDTTDDLVFATKKLGLGLTKFGKRIKEDLVGAPSGSAAETLAYNTAQSASSASQARRDRREEEEDDYGGGGGGGGSMHRSGSGGGLSGALAGLVGGGSHRRDLPPELDSMRDMIDAFVAGSKYWLAMQEALQQLVQAQAAVATAQAQVGELLSASKVADATSQSSGVLAPGAFGSAHAKAASARASAAKEMRLWVLEPLGAHVGAACVDASVDVKEYESGLDDLALQHAHVQKLAAKGSRKAGETAQATAKLEAMRRRLEPLAQRVRSKLELLLEKQDSDAEKWVAKHASCERRLAGELTAAFTATLAFEQRAKGVPRPKVEEVVVEEEEAAPSKRGNWLFGSSGGEEVKKSSKKASKKDKEKSRDAEEEDDVGSALAQSRPSGSARSGAATSRSGGDVALGGSMRRTASEPSGAVDLLPTSSKEKSMRGRLGLAGASQPADPPPPVAAALSRSSRHAAAAVDDDDDDGAAAEAAAKAARKAARRAEKERAAAVASSGGGGGGGSAYGGAMSRDKGGAKERDRDRERHAAQEEAEVTTVSVFAKKKKAQLPEEPPPPPVAEKSRSKRAGW